MLSSRSWSVMRSARQAAFFTTLLTAGSCLIISASFFSARAREFWFESFGSGIFWLEFSAGAVSDFRISFFTGTILVGSLLQSDGCSAVRERIYGECHCNTVIPLYGGYRCSAVNPPHCKGHCSAQVFCRCSSMQKIPLQ